MSRGRIDEGRVDVWNDEGMRGGEEEAKHEVLTRDHHVTTHHVLPEARRDEVNARCVPDVGRFALL